MIKCANCGKERATGKFCPECGSTDIVPEEKPGIECAVCGKIRSRGKFCPECGSSEIVVKPSVMICAKCGTKRMSGKFCAECGSTELKGAAPSEIKPAKTEEADEPEEPIPILKPALAPKQEFNAEAFIHQRESAQHPVQQSPQPARQEPKQQFTPSPRPAQRQSKQQFTPSPRPAQRQPKQQFTQPTQQEPQQQFSSPPRPVQPPGYSQGYGYSYAPRPRKPKPPVSDLHKKCKIVFYILLVVEFIGFFLPLRSLHKSIDTIISMAGESMPSTSLANLSGLLVAIGFLILTVEATLVFFSDYSGAAVGLIFQTIILAALSIIVALSSKDEFRYVADISTHGAGFYVMLLTPLIMLVMSIIIMVQAIKARHYR